MMFIRIFNTKKKLSTHAPQEFHDSYGIQKWLVKKKLCLYKHSSYKVDIYKYDSLLKAFYKDAMSLDCEDIQIIEFYIQCNFRKFCNYTLNLKTYFPK